MEEIWNWILSHWSFCAFILAIFVQIVPAFKWNPITSAIGWLGRQITKGVSEQISSLQDEVKEIKLQRMTYEIYRIRYEVLAFANSCSNHQRHTRDEYMHIFDLNDKYEELLKKTDDTNGVFTAEFEYIQS